jgi:hypothetical protein
MTCAKEKQRFWVNSFMCSVMPGRFLSAHYKRQGASCSIEYPGEHLGMDRGVLSRSSIMAVSLTGTSLSRLNPLEGRDR